MFAVPHKFLYYDVATFSKKIRTKQIVAAHQTISAAANIARDKLTDVQAIRECAMAYGWRQAL